MIRFDSKVEVRDSNIENQTGHLHNSEVVHGE